LFIGVRFIEACGGAGLAAVDHLGGLRAG
jgi:hypothetical protein